jgi:type I restriction-modification system DNA methylase subunit
MSNVVTETSKEKARQEIAKLVEKYQSLSPAAIKKYTEADTKTIFIERLFSALGWDIYGGEEVTQEQRASRGRVDYAFRLRGIPKFFLEAKPLKAALDNPEYAKQVINYAWHKDVTWAILTDFESLKVFNAEWKEPIVSRSQFFELKCDEYLSRFDWLWLLSRPACEQDLLDKRALEDFKKTKKTPVGQQLFSDLVSWRGILANYLSKYNKKYPAYLIDEAVQRILDRLIFIRTCEDRGIEQSTLRPLLREWKNGARKDLIQELRHTWNDFDQGYDSRLFLPHLADELECEPTPFEQIISELYSTKDGSIQYNFNAIGADVLGGIYEQYLEHLIKKKGKEVEVIPGRGKRKAQGIYYTPKFVVRYIVENTLGPALKGKPLSEARKIRILDPACGSGSFLVEAMDYLEKYWQQQKWVPQQKAGEDAQQTDFFDYMTKIQFLTENIHGVDLDAQAVEIAQLNLLLKALSQRERLPNLVNRIHEGNSLISGTEDELKRYFGNKWREKEPFNWEQKFEDIMARDGFDAVIGNPPYVSFGLRGSEKMEKALDRYLRDKFPNSAEYKLSTYAIFIDRGLQLLKEEGYLGYILPDSFLLGRYSSKLRNYILNNCSIKEIVMFEKDFWSSGTVGRPVIIILQKTATTSARRDNIVTASLCSSPEELKSGKFSKTFSYPQSYFAGIKHNRFRLFFDSKSKELAEKIESVAVTANEIVSIHTGVRSKIGQKNVIDKKPSGKTWRKGLISGAEIDRFLVEYKGNYLNIDPEILCSGGWDKEIISQQKLLMRQTGDSLIAAFDDKGYYHLNNLHSIVIEDAKYNLKYILAILNSTLMNHYYHLISLELGRAMAQTDIETIEQLPIHRINFSNPAEKKMHDDLIALVDKMLELNKRLTPLRNTSCNERDELLREINRTDKEIDNLVYALYRLTEEERKIVEER